MLARFLVASLTIFAGVCEGNTGLQSCGTDGTCDDHPARGSALLQRRAATARTAIADCVDNAGEEQCQQYMAEGYCTNDKGKVMCKKTCGLCSGDIGSDGPAQPPSTGPAKDCTGDAAKFDSGYGACVSYGQGNDNHGYCSSDQDNNNRTFAKDVCPDCGICNAITSKHRLRLPQRKAATARAAIEDCVDNAGEEQCQDSFGKGYCKNDHQKSLCKKTCGLCSGNIGSDGPAQTPSTGPGKGCFNWPWQGCCTGDASKFDGGYGDCVSYGSWNDNHEYCSSDQDINNRTFAKDVCPDCGICKPPSLQDKTTTSPPNTRSMCPENFIGTPLRKDYHKATGPDATSVPHIFYDNTLEFEKIASQSMPATFDAASQKSLLMNEDDPSADAYMRIGKLDKNDPKYLIDRSQINQKVYHFKIIYDCQYVIEWEQTWWVDTTSSISGQASQWDQFECLSAPRHHGEGFVTKLWEGVSYEGSGAPDCNGHSAAVMGQGWNGLRTSGPCTGDEGGCAVLDAGAPQWGWGGGGFGGGAVGTIEKPYIGDKMWSYATGDQGASTVELWIARKK